MSPDSILLIKILSDVAMTAMQTVQRVDQMTEEEVKAEILKAELTSRSLIGKVREH